jgi:CrcB protein
MKLFLLVGLGGAIGSTARFGLGALVFRFLPGLNFPLGTFVVNVVGCFAAGLLTGLFENPTRLVSRFVFTGILGGFTTFSAFGIETAHLIRRGDLWIAGLNVFASVACGLMAVWIGMKIVSIH